MIQLIVFLIASVLLSSQLLPQKRNDKFEVREKIDSTVTCKFIYAGVFEGTRSYGFQKKDGSIIYFRSNYLEDKKRIPYDLMNADALINNRYLNRNFKIYFKETLESSDEDEEKRWIKKIVKMKLL